MIIRHCLAPADRPGGTPPPGAGRPGAASMSTDSESGTEALGEAEERRRALYALTVLHQRGLIPTEEYERRRRDLEKAT